MTDLIEARDEFMRKFNTMPDAVKHILAEPLLRFVNAVHESAPGTAKWQSINTAPKDQFVLLACPSGYSTTPWVFTTGVMHSDYKTERWIDHANDDLTDWGMQPTHWMPLLPAPSLGE